MSFLKNYPALFVDRGTIYLREKRHERNKIKGETKERLITKRETF